MDSSAFPHSSNFVSILAVTTAFGAVVLLLFLVCGLGRRLNSNNKSESNKENGNLKNQSKSSKKQVLTNKNSKQTNSKKKDVKHTFNHPRLCCNLKMHGSPVLSFDFSPNGKYLVTCSEDRTLFLWSAKDFSNKDHKAIRGNIEFDHATHVKFSPDSKAILVSLFKENTLRIIKIIKSENKTSFQTGFDFPKVHDLEILNIGISSTGRFIMSATKDTKIIIWNLKGEVLSHVQTNQISNSFCCVSPCGRFFASAGFTPDIKVWEVLFTKSGEFKDVSRAFELKGHTSGVHHFAFSGDSSRMASVSKDGTWKLWKTDIEYNIKQEASILLNGNLNFSSPSLITLSNDGLSAAIANSTSIFILNTKTAKCEETYESTHSYAVSSLSYDNSGKYLLSAGDKNINVYHNMVGERMILQELEERKNSSSNKAFRERIIQQILEANLVVVF